MTEAIRTALEALRAIAAIEDKMVGGDWEEIEEARTIANAAIATLTAEMERPAPEPVAWTLKETLAKRETTTRACLWFSDPQNSSWAPLYAAPQKDQT